MKYISLILISLYPFLIFSNKNHSIYIFGNDSLHNFEDKIMENDLKKIGFNVYSYKSPNIPLNFDKNRKLFIIRRGESSYIEKILNLNYDKLIIESPSPYEKISLNCLKLLQNKNIFLILNTIDNSNISIKNGFKISKNSKNIDIWIPLKGTDFTYITHKKNYIKYLKNYIDGKLNFKRVKKIIKGKRYLFFNKKYFFIKKLLNKIDIDNYFIYKQPNKVDFDKNYVQFSKNYSIFNKIVKNKKYLKAFLFVKEKKELSSLKICKFYKILSDSIVKHLTTEPYLKKIICK